MPNPKITMDQMRIVVEAVEQKLQGIEAQFKQLNQRIQTMEQQLHFGNI